MRIKGSNKLMKTIGCKPSGLLGIFTGKIMNYIHYFVYKRVINTYIADLCNDSDQKTALDIGCGGGISVKLFSTLKGIIKTTGLDYSEEMARLSKNVNKKKIIDGTVEILNADVSYLPFENCVFDIISAFDTINFWPDHKKAIAEIVRTLKKNGSFFIINAYPKEGTKWHEFVKFKNDSEYKEYLITNGFRKVEAVIEKNTIIVWGFK